MTGDCNDLIETAGCSVLKRSTHNDLNLQHNVNNVNNILPTGASFIAMVHYFSKGINFR